MERKYGITSVKGKLHVFSCTGRPNMGTEKGSWNRKLHQARISDTIQCVWYMYMYMLFSTICKNQSDTFSRFVIKRKTCCKTLLLTFFVSHWYSLSTMIFPSKYTTANELLFFLQDDNKAWGFHIVSRQKQCLAYSFSVLRLRAHICKGEKIILSIH